MSGGAIRRSRCGQDALRPMAQASAPRPGRRSIGPRGRSRPYSGGPSHCRPLIIVDNVPPESIRAAAQDIACRASEAPRRADNHPSHAAPRLTNLFPKGVHDRPNPFDVEPKNSQQISSRVAACHLPLRAPPVWRFAFILDLLFCWRFFCRIAEKPGDRFALSNDFRQDPAIINLPSLENCGRIVALAQSGLEL